MTHRTLRVVLLAVLFTLVACGSNKDRTSPELTGQLTLPLTSAANGHEYRLRNAAFSINGPTPAVLTTEDGSDGADGGEPSTAATLVSPDLKPGLYSVLLADPGEGQTAWFLERLDSIGWVRVNASLAPPNPKENVEVKIGGTTDVKFGFETEGTIVLLGERGKIQISAEVTEKLPPNVLAVFDSSNDLIPWLQGSPPPPLVYDPTEGMNGSAMIAVSPPFVELAMTPMSGSLDLSGKVVYAQIKLGPGDPMNAYVVLRSGDNLVAAFSKLLKQADSSWHQIGLVADLPAYRDVAFNPSDVRRVGLAFELGRGNGTAHIDAIWYE